MPGDEELARAVYQALRARGGFSSQEERAQAAGIDAEQAGRGRRRPDDLGPIGADEDGPEPGQPETALAGTVTASQAEAAEQAGAAASLQRLAQALTPVCRPAVAVDASPVKASPVEAEFARALRAAPAPQTATPALAPTLASQPAAPPPAPRPAAGLARKAA